MHNNRKQNAGYQGSSRGRREWRVLVKRYKLSAIK